MVRSERLNMRTNIIFPFLGFPHTFGAFAGGPPSINSYRSKESQDLYKISSMKSLFRHNIWSFLEKQIDNFSKDSIYYSELYDWTV